LVITDRKKHLFVSSGGKNIAPQPIENHFSECKYIDQFVLIGDGRMFLSALIVPDFELLKEYARSSGIRYTSATDLIVTPGIRQLFQSEIDSIQKEFPTYERVRRFELLPQPLTVENGEITPTLKIKRKAVEQKYANMIERMYEIAV
jgi:long-chain acyl-CoA synthetase